MKGTPGSPPARFSFDVDRGTLVIERGSAHQCDTIVDTDRETLRGLIFGGRKLAGAPVELGGDARLARRFFRLFVRPASGRTGGRRATSRARRNYLDGAPFE